MINSDKLKVMSRFRDSMFGEIMPYFAKLADEGLKQGYVKSGCCKQHDNYCYRRYNVCIA